MGYSCTKAAGDTLDRLKELLSPRSAGGPSNGFKLKDGREGFWEIGRENADGAITGSVFITSQPGVSSGWIVEPSGASFRKAGTFRVDPDGKIGRFSLIPGETLRKAEEVLDGIQNR